MDLYEPLCGLDCVDLCVGFESMVVWVGGLCEPVCGLVLYELWVLVFGCKSMMF